MTRIRERHRKEIKGLTTLLTSLSKAERERVDRLLDVIYREGFEAGMQRAREEARVYNDWDPDTGRGP